MAKLVGWEEEVEEPKFERTLGFENESYGMFVFDSEEEESPEIHFEVFLGVEELCEAVGKVLKAPYVEESIKELLRKGLKEAIEQ